MNVDALIIGGAVLVAFAGVAALALTWRKKTGARGPSRVSAGNPACVAKAERLRQNHRIKEARDLLRRAERNHPTSSIIQYRLACYCSLLNEHADARAHLKRACRLDQQWAAPAMYDPDLRNFWRATAAERNADPRNAASPSRGPSDVPPLTKSVAESP